MAASLALPLFTTRFVSPASIDLLTKMTEEEAVRLGNHLATSFPVGADAFRKERFAPWFGEEEFLVLLPETNAEDVLVLAERIRRVVEQHAFPQVGRVTISVGAKVAAEGEESQDLIGRVDEALYAAKDNGRNRVEIAS